MKKLLVTLLILGWMLAGLALPAQAQQAQPGIATSDEALTVAKNWATLIIQAKGNWGGSKIAEVADIQEFKRGERILGYFCRIKPHGFIVISLRKELEPVKAYSEFSDLDPQNDTGMVDLIKRGIERVLDTIEKRLGPIQSARSEDLVKLTEVNYRSTWETLAGDTLTFGAKLGSRQVEMNYQSGQVLLSSTWHQGNPYNVQVPAPPSGDDCTAARCAVGCVATAGAQIMHYWNWPPYGVGSPYNDSYNWPNMPDILTLSSPQAQIDAVAELNHEVGVAVGMGYCYGTAPDLDPCASEATTAAMESVYEDHYRYSSACAVQYRSDYSATDWFNRMKVQFNINRPVQYRVSGHSLLSDSWQEIYVGGVLTQQYHMNYGWGGGANGWYTLDHLYYPAGGTTDDEYMLENIYPAQALGSSLSGSYARQPFPYRYFDQDATGNSATFASGQYLQFLPGITVRCNSTTGGSIRFEGSSSYNTQLFTRGDTSQGIRIYSGAIKLDRYGSIRFH